MKGGVRIVVVTRSPRRWLGGYWGGRWNKKRYPKLSVVFFNPPRVFDSSCTVQHPFWFAIKVMPTSMVLNTHAPNAYFIISRWHTPWGCNRGAGHWCTLDGHPCCHGEGRACRWRWRTTFPWPRTVRWNETDAGPWDNEVCITWLNVVVVKSPFSVLINVVKPAFLDAAIYSVCCYNPIMDLDPVLTSDINHVTGHVINI